MISGSSYSFKNTEISFPIILKTVFLKNTHYSPFLKTIKLTIEELLSAAYACQNPTIYLIHPNTDLG